MESIKEKTKEAFDIMKSEFHYKNIMQAPKIEKVVISCGVGSQKDKKKLDLIEDRLLKITGQKPVRKGAKISIAKCEKGILSVCKSLCVDRECMIFWTDWSILHFLARKIFEESQQMQLMKWVTTL